MCLCVCVFARACIYIRIIFSLTSHKCSHGYVYSTHLMYMYYLRYDGYSYISGVPLTYILYVISYNIYTYTLHIHTCVSTPVRTQTHCHFQRFRSYVSIDGSYFTS